MTDFKKWCDQMQALHGCSGSAHYHKCEDAAFCCVERLLQKIIVANVEKSLDVQLITLDGSTVQILFDWLMQMNFAYLHPRSSSARYAFTQSHLPTPSRKTPK